MAKKNSTLSEQVQAAQEAAMPKAHQGTCPNCGYCPHCGRAAAPVSPFPYVRPFPYPRPYWYAPNQWQSRPTITCNSGPQLSGTTVMN